MRESGSAKITAPDLLSSSLCKTISECRFNPSRVFKKNLSAARKNRFPRRAWSSGWGRGDHSRGAGTQSLPAASAATIYDFYKFPGSDGQVLGTRNGAVASRSQGKCQAPAPSRREARMARRRIIATKNSSSLQRRAQRETDETRECYLSPASSALWPPVSPEPGDPASPLLGLQSGCRH